METQRRTGKQRQVLLVDMDGVIADYLGGIDKVWREHPLVLNNQWYTDIRQVGEHSPSGRYRELFGSASVDLLHEITARPGFYAELPIISGAVDALKFLADSAYVFICTSPSRYAPSCTSEKIDWVVRHFGPVWANRTIITRDKTLVRGAVLIDDKPEVCGVLTPTWEHVLYAAAYNTHLPNRQIRSWAEVLDGSFVVLPARDGDGQ